MVKKITLTLSFLLLISTQSLLGANDKKSNNTLTINSKLTLTLPNQFDKEVTLTSTTKKVIFVFAKATGHTVKVFLKKQDKNYLPSKNILYVADVSGMPSLIRNIFAMPNFKKSPYSIALIYDEKTASLYKNAKNADKITIVTLNNRVITNIQTLTTEKELKAALQ